MVQGLGPQGTHTQSLEYTGSPLRTALSVAIIGGGWAGLAAAVELCTAGASVTVYEAAKRLGGRARSVAIDGRVLDNGQHILIGAYRETLRLIRHVHRNIDKRKEARAGHASSNAGHRPSTLLHRLPLTLQHPAGNFRLRLPPSWLPLPAPLPLAIGLLGVRGVTLAEKRAAARFIRGLQALDYRLDADSSVTSLLDRTGQAGALRRMLWEPLCLAALNTPPEHASAQIFANVLRDSLGGDRYATDLLLPAVDLGQLFPDAAATFIAAHGGRIRLSCRIEHMTRDKQHWCIGDESFDHVIIATAPQHAVPLLTGHAEIHSVATQLGAYDYEPIGTVYAAYPPEVRLPAPMLGLSDAAGNKLGQWAFDHGRLCRTPGLIAFVLSARGRWDERDNAALMVALHQELQAALRRRLPFPVWHKTLRERRATFSCRPDLFRPNASMPLPGLHLAGDYVCADYPATLEGAVRSGIQAARSILAASPIPPLPPGRG